MNANIRMINSQSCSTREVKNIALNILVGFLLVQLAVTPSSFALDPTKTTIQYSHLVWKQEDGLPQDLVQCITQTRDGYLWLGTQEGLIRFDGVQFTVFDRSTTAGLRYNGIEALIQSTDGSLWIGTQDGLTRIRNGKFITYTRADGLANNYVTDLFEDAEGRLWITTLYEGLSVWKEEKFTNYTTKDGLSSNYLTCVSGGIDGSIYIGSTTAGLSRFKDGVFSTYTTANGLASNTITSVCQNIDNVLWVATNAGLSQLKNGKWTTFTTKDGLANNWVRSIYKDRDGNLWIGTNGGLNRIRDNHICAYTSDDVLSGKFVKAFFEDIEGNLWVGTLNNGLNCFRPGRFTVYTDKEGLRNNEVRPIYQTSDSSVWVGTIGGGLSRFKNGSVKTFTMKDGLPSNSIRALCEDVDGSLWIGTSDQGLCRLKNGKFTTWTTKNGLANNFIYSLFLSRDHTLWIGTLGGFNTLKNGKFTTYTTKDGLGSNGIRTILETHDGNLWICSDNGLHRFKDGKLTRYSAKDGLAYNEVFSLFEDENNILWIGTFGGGLSRFKDGRFNSYTTKDGLYNNGVFQILPDEQNNLWMTSNRGVFRVNKKELNDFTEGKIQKIHCTVFGKDNGMISTKCNGSSQPAGIRTYDGKLWIPTLNGVVIIDPATAGQSTLIPPVFIEHAFVNNEEVAIDSLIQVGPGQGELEFHYTALSYAAPQLISFKYMLAGYDKDWIDAGTRRVASYTHIPHGKYTFKVIACNNDGVWNWKGAALELNIAAYFYQTNWFRGLMVIVAILSGLGIHRLRVWRLIVREKILKVNVEEAMSKIKVLNGLIPICANCKKIRDDKGYWNQLEQYINEHSEATFSHGVCPTCAEKLYGGYLSKIKDKRGTILSQHLPTDLPKKENSNSGHRGTSSDNSQS
ncbi:MAG: two-component regulator propeller domain-containing protein [Bacteroidota bacterium]